MRNIVLLTYAWLMAKHYNTQNDSASLSAFFFYVHNVISLLIIVFFRLPCPPLAKRGSLTHSQALALSKRARDVTAPPVALNRYAIRLAGHQSPRQVVRDGTALLKAGHQRSRHVVREGTAWLTKRVLVHQSLYNTG